jgi:hypothetical protein
MEVHSGLPALCFVAVVVAACNGSSTATSSGPAGTAPASLPPSSGPPLPTAQRSLSAKAPGTSRGYDTRLQVIDAQRSLRRGESGPLLKVPGLGTLHVSCSAKPRGRFVLTPFAAGEGPPVVHTQRQAAGDLDAISLAPGSVGGFTGELAMQIPRSEASPHQVLEHVTVSGGGEAFQFTSVISALLTPTRDRCDLLAQATFVTHGPFKRYA